LREDRVRVPISLQRGENDAQAATETQRQCLAEVLG